MSANVMVLAEHTDGKISDGTYELIGQARELAGALGAPPRWPCSGRPTWPASSAAPTSSCASSTRRWSSTCPRPTSGRCSRYWPSGRRDCSCSRTPPRPGPRCRALGPLGRAPGRLRQRAGGRRWRRRGHGADPGRESAGRGGAARRARHRHPARGRVQPAPGAAAAARPPPRSSMSARPPASPRCGRRCAGWSRPPGGDVDISAADVLVSVGRGIESQDNLETVLELADGTGRPPFGIPAGGGRRMAGEVAPGGPVGPEGQAPGVPGLRHLGSPRAPGGHAALRADHRLQHRPGGADLRRRPLSARPWTCSTWSPSSLTWSGTEPWPSRPPWSRAPR